MLERDVRHYDIGILQVLIQDRAYPLGPEQCRIALHERVQSPLPQEVGADAFNLAGRAAVHCRQGHVVGNAVRNPDVPHLGIEAGNLINDSSLVFGAVLHLVQEPLHVRLLDALEVVADAEIKYDARRLARKAELVVQRMYQNPGTKILIEGLFDSQFLRPLDVVTFVLHVDAGLGNIQYIECLYRLEFNVTRAAQPGGHDVLRHLRVRPRGRAERCLE